MSEEWLPWEKDGPMYGPNFATPKLDFNWLDDLFGNFDTPEDNQREREKGE